MTEPILLWGTTATELDVFGERLRDARVIQRLKGQAVAEAAQLRPDPLSLGSRGVQFSRTEWLPHGPHGLTSTF